MPPRSQLNLFIETGFIFQQYAAESGASQIEDCKPPREKLNGTGAH